MWREACALSQQQVADALNIERSTYTKYETGGSEPNLSTLVKISRIYNISPMELLPMDSEASLTEAGAVAEGLNADSPIYQLSKDERGLIALYRVLSREEKKQAREMVGRLTKNTQR